MLNVLRHTIPYVTGFLDGPCKFVMQACGEERTQARMCSTTQLMHGAYLKAQMLRSRACC